MVTDTTKHEVIKVYARLRPRLASDGHDARAAPPADGVFLSDLGDDASASETCFASFAPSGQVEYARPSRPSDPSKVFKFSGCFGPEASQAEVFDGAAADVVDGTLSGYNGTLLAYGQTGSGKTHTMRGEGGEATAGLASRALTRLLAAKAAAPEGVEISLSLSYLQIYCEVLTDLLAPDAGSLLVREDKGNIFVDGLSRHPVGHLERGLELLRSGDGNRSTAATALNAQSSRSHAVVLVHVERRERKSAKHAKGTVLESTLVMVDLAGSERAKRSLATNARFDELKAINLSLSALGNCVSALATNQRHVPYRDSRLTRLLQPSLGGNARTALLVTVTPGGDETGENLSSLLLAQRASRVAVSAKQNRVADYAALFYEAQAALDAKDDASNRHELEAARLRGEAEAFAATLAAAQARAAALEQSLAREQTTYESSVAAMQEASADPGGGRAVEAIEMVNEKWRSEVDALTAAHAAEVASLKGRHGQQVEAYKASAEAANREWAEAEEELGRERRGHLETLASYKESREKLRAAEADAAGRVGELLLEAEARARQVDELSEALGQARATGDSMTRVGTEMQARLQLLEEDSHVKKDVLDRDYVSRKQVDAMEGLFAETLERLVERVKGLEAARTAGGGGREASMSGGARKVLEDMERAQAGAPVVQRGRKGVGRQPLGQNSMRGARSMGMGGGKGVGVPRQGRVNRGGVPGAARVSAAREPKPTSRIEIGRVRRAW